jgi:uncharacterized protein (DUF1684 family)
MRIHLLVLATLTIAANAVLAAEDYAKSIETWRENREASLKRPEGWFSYAGSGIVNPGTSTIGAAADNTIVLPSGPASLGTLTLDTSGIASFRAAADSGATIDGVPVDDTVVLEDNADGGTPTRVGIGTAWFHLVRMGEVIGWRFRDPDSPALKAFTGLDNFPIDPSWRIEADWQPYDPAHEIELLTIINTLTKAPVPGKATFERDGRRFELEPVLEDDGTLFFIFADQTSGKETYGAGRFVYAQPAANGKVVIDFNKAFNPPCALSPHVVCPTAPASNRLRLRVTAGEKRYRKAAH